MKLKKLSGLLLGLLLSLSLSVSAFAAAPGGPGGPGGFGGPGGPGGSVNYYSVSSSPITVNEGKTYTVTLTAEDTYTWSVANGTDVTGWFVQSSGAAAFEAKSGAATVTVSADKKTATVSLNAAKIGAPAVNGSYDLYVQPADSAIASASRISSKQVGSVQVPTLSVQGEVYGSSYDNGASTVMSDEPGMAFVFTQGATLSLSLPGLDNSKIDSSKATVSVTTGDGYYINDYLLNAVKLNGTWSNGQLVYILSPGDIMFDTEGKYVSKFEGMFEDGSAIAFSNYGGDGTGNYYINLKVSGITYNGVPVASQTIVLHLYAFGREATDLANLNFQTVSPAWSWSGEGDKPILCDPYEDDFIIRWPAAVDASAVTAKDITITLKSENGEQKTLEPGTDYILNVAAAGKTEIAVRYQQWAYLPVYTTMTIEVNERALSASSSYYKIGGLSSTWDIASVYAYSIQAGGAGGDDHGVTFNYYGVYLESWEQVQNPIRYRLVTADGQYYSKNGGLTTNVDDAWSADGTGPDDYNYQLIDHHIVVVTMRETQTVEKTVNGKTVAFTKQYYAGVPYPAGVISSGDYGSLPYIDPSIEYLPGYTASTSATTPWLDAAMWPWMASFNVGWLSDWSQVDESPVLTRAMAAKAIYDLETINHGRPAAGAANRFSDVAAGTEYANAIAWATEKGIVNGYGDGRFGPNDPVTREQLAVMLWRYAGQPSVSSALAAADAGQVSGFAANAVTWAMEKGVLSDKNGAVDPQGRVTCAQVAQMIYPLIVREAH